MHQSDNTSPEIPLSVCMRRSTTLYNYHLGTSMSLLLIFLTRLITNQVPGSLVLCPPPAPSWTPRCSPRCSSSRSSWSSPYKQTDSVIRNETLTNRNCDHWTALPKYTSSQDFRLRGQSFRDGFLAVDAHWAVVLFVHYGLDRTVARPVQLQHA